MCFSLGKTLQLSLMFASKAIFGLGKLLALLEKIRLDWKCLLGTDTLAYYEHS